MSVEYTLVQRGNPAKKEAPKKYYAQAKSSGEVSLREVCTIISDRSTASKGDVTLILDGFVHTLLTELAKGKIVRLGEFGSFQVAITGKGADKPDKFTSSMIEKATITFRPGSDLKDMLNTLSFEKIKTL